MKKRKSVFVVSLSIVVLLGMLLINSCAIHPVAWQPSPTPAFVGMTGLNEKLSTTQKILLKGWYGPEDIVFDGAGAIYCGVHAGENEFSDGRILKIDSNGTITTFYNSESWVAGLHFDQRGNLLALSHKTGLISINPDKKMTVLANKDEQGNALLIPNGLDVASDGKIYFTNTSDEAAYTINNGRKIILEMRPVGGLYCYDPVTANVKTLMKGTYFGNGVVLAKDESYLLMVETSKYRVIRYWLKGSETGKSELFIDNLPGFPNGISIRNDGSFWLGFSTKRNGLLDKIHPKPTLKKLIYAMPAWMQPKTEKFGMIMNISVEGKILETLFDTSGNFVPESGTVKEKDGYLYIGGDTAPFIGKYKL